MVPNSVKGTCRTIRKFTDLAVTKINTGIVAAAVGKAEAVTGESPHLCRSSRELDAATTVVPLFPPIDQWGALPFPSQPLTPHSLSRRMRDVLAGDLGAHRHPPVDRDDDVKVERAGAHFGAASRVHPSGFATGVGSTTSRPRRVGRRRGRTHRRRSARRRTQPASGRTAR
jgi:hypothetical protein